MNNLKLTEKTTVACLCLVCGNSTAALNRALQEFTLPLYFFFTSILIAKNDNFVPQTLYLMMVTVMQVPKFREVAILGKFLGVPSQLISCLQLR